MEKPSSSESGLVCLDKPVIPLSVTKFYWILNVPYYSTYVFYGTLKDVQSEVFRKNQWEHCKAKYWIANPENPKDKAMVVNEIQSIWEDRAAGIKNLPFYPGKGWV